MLWNHRRDSGPLDPGAAARALHSRWLSLALAGRLPFLSGKSGKPARGLPRIPVRRVDTGGFSALMDLPSGPKQAERWWSLALGRVPDAE